MNKFFTASQIARPPRRIQGKWIAEARLKDKGPASFSFGVPPLARRNSPLKSRNVSLIHHFSASSC
jgi:hypothetical protein